MRTPGILRRRRGAMSLSLGVAALAVVATITPAYAQSNDHHPQLEQAVRTAPVGHGVQPNYGASDLFAISRDHQGVYHWLGAQNWENIGDAAGRLFAGEGVLLASNPNTGKIYRWLGGRNWQYFGEPGADFCVTRELGHIAVIGLRPDHSGVYERQLTWTGWKKIGNEAGSIICGDSSTADGGELYATNPHTGDIYGMNGAFGLDRWHHLGGPGRKFAANGNGLYGLTPNGKSVNWSPYWESVGGAADTIYAGGAGRGPGVCASSCPLLATNPVTHDLYVYWRLIDWHRIGGPGQDFTISEEGNVYGLSPDGTRVFAWNGAIDQDSHWDLIGTHGAAQIAAS